jgi:hypothetical protein
MPRITGIHNLQQHGTHNFRIVHSEWRLLATTRHWLLDFDGLLAAIQLPE